MGTQDSWDGVQKHIRDCAACVGHRRVALAIRQQTPPPQGLVRLLLAAVAPPYENGINVLTTAKSATNDPDDKLRAVIAAALSSPWNDLTAKGLFLIHAVKCAIIPDQRGFQYPPTLVIDRCIPQHFAAEFTLLRAPHVVAFGRAPLRATLKHPLVTAPRGVGVSRTLRALLQKWPQGIPCDAGGRSFTLHVSPFPRSIKARKRAAVILRGAALRSEVLPTLSEVTRAETTPRGDDSVKSTTFQLKGKTFTISRDDVFRGARSAPPEAVTKFYVEIDGRRFPPTQLVRVGANTRDATYSANSRSILTRLGFTVKSLR